MARCFVKLPVDFAVSRTDVNLIKKEMPLEVSSVLCYTKQERLMTIGLINALSCMYTRLNERSFYNDRISEVRLVSTYDSEV